MKELELRYQNELMLMQNEINRIRDNEVNRNSQNKVENCENSSSFTHRKLVKGDLIFKHNQANGTPISINYNNISQNSGKMQVLSNQLNSQKHFSSHQKAMSICNNSVANNAAFSGSHSTKKVHHNINKIANDMQNNLIRACVNKGDNENSAASLEFSARTPDKSNPEMSPYMMDFYKKKRAFNDDTFASKVRSSGGIISSITKGNIEYKRETSQSPDNNSDSSEHK